MCSRQRDGHGKPICNTPCGRDRQCQKICQTRKWPDPRQGRCGLPDRCRFECPTEARRGTARAFISAAGIGGPQHVNANPESILKASSSAARLVSEVEPRGENPSIAVCRSQRTRTIVRGYRDLIAEAGREHDVLGQLETADHQARR